MFMFGIRDETFLQNLDAWMAFIDGDITTRCEELLGPGGRDLAVAPGPPGAWAAVAAGVADVVDAGTQHLAGRLEADAADRGELVGGQR